MVLENKAHQKESEVNEMNLSELGRDKKMRQASFGFFSDYKKEFGGNLLIGKRKTARPLSTKHPIHLVLKSTGNSIFNPSDRTLEKVIKDQAHKFKVKIYDLALNWTHIHAIIYFKDKDFYVKFIRALCSILVSYFSNKLKKDLKGLFDLRPFTKIISWGPEFKNALNYVTINQMESWGLIKREKKSPQKKNKPLREKRNKSKT